MSLIFLFIIAYFVMVVIVVVYEILQFSLDFHTLSLKEISPKNLQKCKNYSFLGINFLFVFAIWYFLQKFHPFFLENFWKISGENTIASLIFTTEIFLVFCLEIFTISTMVFYNFFDNFRENLVKKILFFIHIFAIFCIIVIIF